MAGEAGDAATPAKQSGTLTAQSLPQAGQLGKGWKPYVDPGGHEKGFASNASWVRERDSREIVVSLKPVGCAGDVPDVELPVPTHALEGTYAGAKGATGVSVVMEFASSDQTPTFTRELTRQLRACGDNAPGSLRVTVLEESSTTLADRRRDPSVPGYESTEVLVADGTRVGLLLVTVPTSAPRPRPSVLADVVRGTLRQ